MVCDMVCDPRGPPLPPGDPRGDPRVDPQGDPGGPPRTPDASRRDGLQDGLRPPRTPAPPPGPPGGPSRTPGDPRGTYEASRQDGLRAASEEGMQENAGLHQGQRAGVQRDVREWGRLRSHPKEEVVQEGGLCPESRGRLRLRGLLGLRGGRRSRLPNPAWSRAGGEEEEEVLPLPVGGARAPPRAEARLAPRAPAGRCAPRAALADLARVD